MKKWNYILLTIMLTQLSCNSKKHNYIKRIDGSIIEKEQLDKKVKSLMREAHVTGLALSIINDNKIAYQKAFGYANHETKDTLDINHIFYGASLSKSVFGYLIAQLANENKIDFRQTN